MVEEPLAALASETRRRVLERLVVAPRSVQELADELPVSRPAVSQHLKVLVDAGLASVTADGTRRVYAADPDGVEALRAWTDQLWTTAMNTLGVLAEEQEPAMPKLTLEPVVKTLRTAWTAAEAFEVFTTRVNDWWPLATHSVGDEHATSVTIEPGVGGQLVETTDDGARHVWGTILEWTEGRHLAFTWHPGQPEDLATIVDVRFRDVPGGSEALLVHVGWEVRGAQAADVRARYETGWDPVLARFAAA